LADPKKTCAREDQPWTMMSIGGNLEIVWKAKKIKENWSCVGFIPDIAVSTYSSRQLLT
jgi:homoserine kinase